MISGEQSLEGSLNGSSSLMGVLNSEGGVKDYNLLNNKPQINNVTLEGNLSSNDLGIQDLLVSGQNIKTINNDSILGEGNIEINPTDVQVNGSSITSSGVANLITNTEYDATNNKLATMSDMPDLTNYVQRTTYPTPEGTGVIKTGNYFLTNLGVPYVSNLGYEVYEDANNNIFISKGTLENVIEGKNLQNQVSTLPTASSDNVGKTYQYVGVTDANYTNGYFYQCISDGASTPTYSWERIDVQPNSGGTVTDIQVNGTSILSSGVANLITEGTYNANSNKIATMDDLPTKKLFQANLSKNTNVSTSAAWGLSTIKFDNIEYNNTGAVYDSTTGELTIPAGVSYAKVTMTVIVVATHSGRNFINYIFRDRNGESINKQLSYYVAESSRGYYCTDMGVSFIDVQEGDKLTFKLQSDVAMSNQQLIKNATRVIVEMY